MARLLLIPDNLNGENLVAPALVLKATDYWPRIFLHAVWRELQAGDNQGRRLLRVTYAGLDLVYMYEYPSAAAGERKVTQEDFTPELRLKQLLDTLGVRRFQMPKYACTSFVIGHIMHAHIMSGRAPRSRVSSWSSSRLKVHSSPRSTFKTDPLNSSITTFRFSSADTVYTSPNAQTSPSFVLQQEDRALAERVVGNPLLNISDARCDECAQGQRSPIPGKPRRQYTLLCKTAPAYSGRSASTTLPSRPSLPQSPDEDVFTEAKRPYRGDLSDMSGQRPSATSGYMRNFPTPPTLSSDSSGSSISTLATPASPSPAPRHRAQGRLSLPTLTPTPAMAESSRRTHARMSLVLPPPTPSAPVTESRVAYRNSLDLSELARCRLWDTKGKDVGRGRVRDKEDSLPIEYAQSLLRQRL